MTAHIDTMQEWWKLAEVGIPQAGDTVLFDERHRGRGFRVMQATKDHPRGYDNARILSRAPKPKPAWHDAPAVIASTDYCERQVWQRDTTYGTPWYGTEGDGAVTSDLRDVTPLIEAKVTDEMVKRALGEAEEHGYIERVFGEVDGIDQNAFRAILTAALGLEIA